MFIDRPSASLRRHDAGVIALGLALVLFKLGTAFAQEAPVPVETQVPLFLKILSYDRHLKPRSSGGLVVGVLYQDKFRASLNAKEEFVAALGHVKPESGDPVIRVVLIEARAPEDLGKMITKESIDALFVTPLRAIPIDSITALSRSNKVITLTGVPKYVNSGLAIGVDLKGGKPQIIINLDATLAEGSDFDSRLLQLVKIVKSGGEKQ